MFAQNKAKCFTFVYDFFAWFFFNIHFIVETQCNCTKNNILNLSPINQFYVQLKATLVYYEIYEKSAG